MESFGSLSLNAGFALICFYIAHKYNRNNIKKEQLINKQEEKLKQKNQLDKYMRKKYGPNYAMYPPDEECELKIYHN